MGHIINGQATPLHPCWRCVHRPWQGVGSLVLQPLHRAPRAELPQALWGHQAAAHAQDLTAESNFSSGWTRPWLMQVQGALAAAALSTHLDCALALTANDGEGWRRVVYSLCTLYTLIYTYLHRERLWPQGGMWR